MSTAPLLPEPDRLERLVTTLDAVASSGGFYQPHQIFLVDDVAVELRLLPPDDHPLTHLLGFVVPPEWWAVGAVCFGWARSMSAARGVRRRARIVTAVDRDGHEAATTTLDDGSVIDEPGTGMVQDALRRCLGLPTAPPASAPSAWRELRLRVVAGDTTAGLELSPDVAAWMDDGMFSRWVAASAR